MCKNFVKKWHIFFSFGKACPSNGQRPPKQLDALLQCKNQLGVTCINVPIFSEWPKFRFLRNFYGGFSKKSVFLQFLSPVLRLYSDCTQTVLVLYSDCTSPVLRLYSDCIQTVLRLYSDCTSPVLRLYSDCTQTVFNLILLYSKHYIQNTVLKHCI